MPERPPVPSDAIPGLSLLTASLRWQEEALVETDPKGFLIRDPAALKGLRAGVTRGETKR